MTAALDSYLILLDDLSGIQGHVGVVGGSGEDWEKEKGGKKTQTNRFLEVIRDCWG